MTAPFQVGPGIQIGPGIKIGTFPPVTCLGQNVSGTPSNPGFFFAVLNRGYSEWEYFAANGNDGTWTATGDFGLGTTTLRVISTTHDADSMFPLLPAGNFFQPGNMYSFTGY